MYKAVLKNGMLTKSTDGSAGYDVYATEDCFIEARGYGIVDTGVVLDIDKGYCAILTHRSSINFKNHQIVPIGLIDSDFNKDDNFIKAKFYNMSNEGFTIKKGERVAQILLLQHFEIIGAENKCSERNGGFGSTN